MHVSIRLPPSHSFHDLEQSVFAFTGRLDRYCGSITACTIEIEVATRNHSRHPAFIVTATLTVFGEQIRVIGTGSAPERKDALSRALNDAFIKAQQRLDDIVQDHPAAAADATSPDDVPSFTFN